MITYVDTSTLIKLIVDEEGSDRAELIWQSADSVASVSLVVVEARAALAAAGRGKRLSTGQLHVAKTLRPRSSWTPQYSRARTERCVRQPNGRACTSPTR